jgi:thiol-disulfide isomerase/thioredoxin
MKQIANLLFAAFFALSACTTNKNEAIIKGKIIGEIPEYLKYSESVNEICLGYFNKQLEIDSTGFFEFKLNISKPVFTELFYPEKEIWLIIEPGESYNIEINCNDGSFTIEGKNEKLMKVYQNLLIPMHPNMECVNYINFPVSVAKSKIDSMLAEESQIFEKLFSEKKISKDVFELVKHDRNLFYHSLLGATFKIKYFNTVLNDRKANTDSIANALNAAVTNISFDDESFLRSKWTFYHLESYLESKEFSEKDYYLNDRKEAREKELYHTYRIDYSNKYLSGSIREYYKASYLLINAYQKKYEKELITLFENFKTEFPKSNYTEFIEPHINEIIQFHQKAELEFEEEIIFIQDYQNIKTWDELLKSFNGRKVYVDIWATWCGPCKDEFKYSKEAKKLLDTNNISMLYISLDIDSREKPWNDMIKFYNLKGVHIKANNELKKDIDFVLNRKGVPHYVLIDENGNVILNDAPYPSQMKELKELIENN